MKDERDKTISTVNGSLFNINDQEIANSLGISADEIREAKKRKEENSYLSNPAISGWWSNNWTETKNFNKK